MSAISECVLALTDRLSAYQTAVMAKSETFRVLLTAALTKSADYAREVHGDASASGPYFTTATLRGICEDFIALTFISTIPEPDRDSWLLAWNMHTVSIGIGAQTSFFGSDRSFQPVMHHTGLAALHDSARTELQATKTKFGWRFPRPDTIDVLDGSADKR